MCLTFVKMSVAGNFLSLWKFKFSPSGIVDMKKVSFIKIKTDRNSLPSCYIFHLFIYLMK